MDAGDFLQMTLPVDRTSKLAPFWHDILRLRANKRTLSQVLVFLNANGVQITITGLSKYIQRREAKEQDGAVPNPVACKQDTSVDRSPINVVSTQGVAGRLEETNSRNPLRALSGSRGPDDFSPLPTSKIEIEE